MLLPSPGQLGDACWGRQAPGRRMAGRSCGHRVVQQPGVVHEGFRLLVAVDPTGVVTGFGFCAASIADQPLAETFFAVQDRPNPGLSSVGSAFTSGPYVADKGFEGEENHRRWLDRYGARVIHPPKSNSRKPWPKDLRRWLASVRQIVETVYDKLFNTFGLWRERPHELGGLRARLAARVAPLGGSDPQVEDGRRP
jgi:hypothetical protein